MKFVLILPSLAAVAFGAYSGDIVQYWVNQSDALVSSNTIGGLYSPPSAWFMAIVQGSIYSAALTTRHEPRAFQQLALSHAAHDALAWTFHGARLSNEIDSSLRAVITQIGIAQSSPEYQKASRIGQDATSKIAAKRAGDGLSSFVDYSFGPPNPGVYQATPGGRPLPDSPQAVSLRPFGGVKNLARFRAPSPPNVTAAGYEQWVVEAKDLGALNSTKRTKEQTEIAYFWLEPSVKAWNMFAHAIVGSSLANDVLASAKFYAQLNFALANAAIAAWDTKYYYNHWRPVTAIQRRDIWLQSGRNISDPSWVPLLRPTPSHPDYVSTHATFGGAGAAVLKYFNKGDQINTSFSSSVTLDNQGIITRHFISIDEAALENARSRVYGGIHFTYAGSEGIKLGDAIARETLDKFDSNWNDW